MPQDVGRFPRTNSDEMSLSKRRKRSSSESMFVKILLVSSAVMIGSVLVLHRHGAHHPNSEHTEIHDRPIILPEPTVQTCFPHNSEQWLQGPRIGNSDDPLLTEDRAFEMILHSPKLISGSTMQNLLKQTICHEKSRFLNWTDDGSEERSLHFWTLRLMYLAFHAHQHNPALKEAQIRQIMSGQCSSLLKERGIGDFDYECPDAKFLVVPLGELGLGAVMRLGAVNGLIAGMATNRTVLFMNNSPVGYKTIQTPWIHASCERRDIQCFYLPPSPCVLTHEEVTGAHVLERGEARKMFRFGEEPAAHAHDRVLVLNIVLRPQRTPESLRPNLRKGALGIIDEIRKANQQDGRLAILERAAEHILDMEPDDPSRPYYYFGANSKAHHAAVFYSMRPRLLNAKLLDEIVGKVFPEDFDPELSLGLPVRASDKCLMESECLSFPQYMKLMGQIWTKNQPLIRDTAVRQSITNEIVGNIVLTTESESIFRDKEEFQSDPEQRKSVPFAYRIVTNDGDVRQGTGLPTNFAKRNVTADEIMLSAVSSLKTQLMARFTVGNCCSNFHLLLFDFLRDGCGAARDNVGECLQENEDPEFRVCCMWSTTDECKQKKEVKQSANTSVLDGIQ